MTNNVVLLWWNISTTGTRTKTRRTSTRTRAITRRTRTRRTNIRTSTRTRTRTTPPRTHLLSQYFGPLQAISPFPIHEAPGKTGFLPSFQQQKQCFPYPPCNDNISPPRKRKIIASRRGCDSSQNTYCSDEEKSRVVILGDDRKQSSLKHPLRRLQYSFIPSNKVDKVKKMRPGLV